jgi:predicted aspartyl protease
VQYNKIVCACIGLVLTSSALARTSDPPEDVTGRLPFRLYQNYLIVAQGSLGKLKKRNLLIDTGANPTVVDERVAQQLSVKPLPDSGRALGLISGSVNGRFAVLSSVAVGPLRAKNLRVAVADLSALNSKIGVRVDAVVGVDVLGQGAFRIDYERKEMIFGPVDFDSTAIPFGSDDVFVTVPITVDDRFFQIMVDTGSAGVVLFANRVGELHRQLPLAGLARMTSLGGAAPIPVVRLERLRVGSQDLGPRNAYIARELACCNFDGVLGVSALRVRQIEFDFPRRLVGWQLRDR